MNILFKTYAQMKEIEQLLLNQKYDPRLDNGKESYYSTHDTSSINRIRNTRRFLVVIVNLSTKTYMITYSTDPLKKEYIYSSMRSSILNILKIPNYNAKKITINRS